MAARRLVRGGWGLGALLAGCWGSGRPAPVDDGVALALGVDVPFAEIEIPAGNRPGGAVPATDIPLDGPWRALGPLKGMSRYEMDIPVRPRGLFFHTPQPGLELVDATGARVPYERGANGKTHWNHDRDKLVVALPGDREAPAPGELHLRWPKAVARERALNLSMSGGVEPAAFVRTSVQAGWDSRQGVLVPAPGKVAWDITVPPAGELHFAPGIVEPEVLDARPSDGATLIVEIEADGVKTEVYRGELAVGKFAQQRVDLSRWAGKAVRLRVLSEPKATPDFDYVFLGEPVVSSRERNPTTVLLVFVDTLRPDHLGTYGYGRPTSRPLDDWAKRDAVVFENARSVAPWTLPSARAILTGRQPEEFAVAETLQARLRAQGWATGMIAGNVYLSPNFDMDRGWDFQHVTNWPDGDEVTAQAMQWLDAHEGRDRLLLVHYMDPHLPYKEPGSYRHAFAGDTPAGFSEQVSLDDARKAQTPEQQEYVKDRYDNNVKFAVDEASKVIAMADDNDIVVFFADHGEELWDHKGFEHGHTLFDELLRVPLVVRVPGLAAGRQAAPVSLLDITPTVLDALGLPAGGLDGTSLLPAARGDAAAVSALEDRDQAFGRPLYGSPRWGVLHDGQKWTTTEGREALYDLASDPGEKANLAKDDQSVPGPAYRGYLAAVLGRDVDAGFRIAPARAPGPLGDKELTVTVSMPGGIKAAWPGDDPLKGSEVTVVVGPLDTTGAEPMQQATFTWEAGFHGTREAYVVPTQPVEGVTQRAGFVVTCGGETKTMTIPEARGSAPGKTRLPLANERVGGRAIAISWGFAPQPNAETSAIDGADDELKSALEAMGYVEGRDAKNP